MSYKTSIEWTDCTWNPVRGCSRVSAGCARCYAERQAARFRGDDDPFRGFAYSDKAGPHWTGRVELIPSKLDEPLRWRKPRRIFVNSMSDLFHERLSDEAIAAVFGVMAACPQHTFQVLTKRPEGMRRWFEWLHNTQTLFGFDRIRYCAKVAHNKSCAVNVNRDLLGLWGGSEVPPAWPLTNVWLGVSVEDQETADERIPLLLQTPAAVRFVSYEPALAGVDFNISCARSADWMPHGTCSTFNRRSGRMVGHALGLLDWLIVGGESGPGARPCDIAWARSAVAQCKAAGVPVFVKQLGARPTGEPWLKANGKWVQQHYHPARRNEPVLSDRKGGDPSEWPEDLRVREFPEEGPR